MTEADRDALVTCQVCGTWRYVPSLARQCEARHTDEQR